jgi:methylenetetrahydrofolate dehydrogenase (NADP+)/methenyltetrahydrofolate cyclohydrolase
MAQIIDGKAESELVLNEVRLEVSEFAKRGITLGLAMVMVGENPASQVYVGNKTKKANEVGIYSQTFTFPESVTEEELIKFIHNLNSDSKFNGILVQLPLPAKFDANKVLGAISERKDVDGITPKNLGMLANNLECVFPCTPYGILHLLKKYQVQIAGAHVVVLGRSSIVGKPISLMLLNENATVTMCHSHTKNLSQICKSADILIAAIGKKEFVTAEFIKEGAVVIDVGINRISLPEGKSKLYGDVDFGTAEKLANLITPVPGGIGPMTVAMLFKNVLTLAKRQNG